ncbi:hypothetical protein [Rossellomorea vietnamensis]|uniref:hypothetical protein n=1 Tax=Rossellomorea vietnamensis TaxID=218284 RepID=UPI001E47F7CB|nr:hypothetical protein [Rossellomorea vietnamensis]MCC5803766.1 hypothetical protein [Rossellomorea vietnamensis]
MNDAIEESDGIGEQGDERVDEIVDCKNTFSMLQRNTIKMQSVPRHTNALV